MSLVSKSRYVLQHVGAVREVVGDGDGRVVTCRIVLIYGDKTRFSSSWGEGGESGDIGVPDIGVPGEFPKEGRGDPRQPTRLVPTSGSRITWMLAVSIFGLAGPLITAIAGELDDVLFEGGRVVFLGEWH